MKLVIMFLIQLLIVSCGDMAQRGNPFNPETVQFNTYGQGVEAEFYSYHFQSHQCSTGLHEAQSLNKICKTLLNDELNNFCKRDERLNLYESNC